MSNMLDYLGFKFLRFFYNAVDIGGRIIFSYSLSRGGSGGGNSFDQVSLIV